ncbi:hypothetical protein L6452_43228 [Arctium lappa]|uniref:Uncharacterized protein n=1 Tax=Arctium lappa TaxID=4217 RepID=A0ACB8XLK8_ARCLA|nr:hypothetical protein L6452_43228 [Arctium lappa]
MPTTFERNLTLCFNKIKRLQSPPTPPPPPHHHHRHRRRETTVHNPKSNLIKNFNTLYDIPPDSDDPSNTTTTAAAAAAAAPDFFTAVASNRFFFSSPGRSNSIIESSSPSTSSLASTVEISPEDVAGGVAIPTISPDPYFDFRKSMQEMVEARDLIDVRANWDYLHELLTCYLDLNPKSAHKFIVGAFADLLVSLMASSAVDGGGGCRNL